MNYLGKVNGDEYLASVVKSVLFSGSVPDADSRSELHCVSAVIPKFNVVKEVKFNFASGASCLDEYQYPVREVCENLLAMGVKGVTLVTQRLDRALEARLTTIVPNMDDFSVNQYCEWLKVTIREKIALCYPDMLAVYVEPNPDLFVEDELEQPCPTGSVNVVMADMVGSVFGCELNACTYFTDDGVVNPLFKFVLKQ
ncbi:hypothetical protein TOTORO_03260 [Serratia phage vB_SmaS-Totoro]|nr:hypothetical protein TOTORO_03260 [Serratia phage vB_SmaS-Totoro]